MRKRKTPYETLPAVPIGCRPKVLLVGNGLNRSFDGAKEMDPFIREQWKAHYETILPERSDNNESHELWQLPFPQQVVVATKDHVQGCLTELTDHFKKLDVSSAQKELIRSFLDVGFDAVLSTNYSLEFEKSLFNPFTTQKVQSSYKTTQEQTAQQAQFGIFQCTELPDDHKTLLWHIHGTALRKNSLVMGQFYYGKLLSEVTTRASKACVSYKAAATKHFPFQPKSWVDYFLIADVYIVGFNLDLSESDIWWLLNFKKNAFPETKTFFFAPEINAAKKLLLDCYEVEMPPIEFDEKEEKAYVKYYRRVCEDILRS